MKKIVIIGAGISGLAAGWYHKQKGNQVTILEKSDRVGGWIRTTLLDDFLFEEGPRGFRPSGKGKRTLALVKELGLEKELLPACKEAKIRYLAKKGKLHRFYPFRPSLLFALLRYKLTSPSQEEDESIASFCSRRFGRKITNTLVDPLVKGIFGGKIDELSMKSCFPSLWDGNFKKPERSLVPLYSFRNGMETLTQALGRRLEEHIVLNTPVSHIEKLEADLIIAAIPSPAFTYRTLTTVNLGWKSRLLPKRGFGFLVPSSENEKIMGMTWDSELFPEQNRGEMTRICVMLEGEQTGETALDGVKNYLGIERHPDATLIRYPKLPHYLVGHAQRLSFFQKHSPALFIGNAYSGVGVNDCIEAAWKSAL